MSDKTALGDRMKGNYESRAQQYLIRRMPTIIRLDGKAFHSYTKGLDKPFDEGLIEDMQETTKFLCENIQGAKLGYTQSDEITIVLTDYEELNTQMWYDGNVQKITSVSASLATAKFNQLRLLRFSEKNEFEAGNHPDTLTLINEVATYDNIYDFKLAFFDARVFQIPEKEEVLNCLIWRQRDAERNSISMLAQSLYSHKELDKKNTSDMQEMCFQRGHNWNNLDYSKKRGSLIVKNTYINGILLKENNDDAVIGDIWYQPDNIDGLYPDKRGRLLQLAVTSEDDEDWCDIPIISIRTKWEVTETPIFSQSRETILNIIK